MLSSRLFAETGGFREDMEIAEDYELRLRVTYGYEVGYINEPLVIKRGKREEGRCYQDLAVGYGWEAF